MTPLKSDFGSGGWGFESLRARQFFPATRQGIRTRARADEQEEKPDLQEGVSGRGGWKADVDTDEAKRSNPSGRASHLKGVWLRRSPFFVPL